jgi:hypothetical protein
MLKAGEGVEEIPPPPKGDGSGGKSTQPMVLRRACVWSNSPPRSSNLSSKERLTSSRTLKAENWLLPLHQMKRSMLHPKKKPRASEEERKIRNATTLLPLTMIICHPLASLFQYMLVKPPV